MSRRRVAALGLVLLMAAGSIALYRTKPRDGVTTPLAQAPATRPKPPTGAPPAPKPVAPTPAPSAVPADKGDVFADLRERADAGDSRAACNLAYHLLSCRHRSRRFEGRMLADMAEAEREFEDKGRLAAANRLADRQARLLAMAGICRGIPDALKDAGSQYLRQAALAGDPTAMLAYANGFQFAPSGRGMAADPTFDAWRNESPALLHRALESGDPRAVFRLALAYHDDMGFPSLLIPDDPYRAGVYHLLWVRLFRAREQRMWMDALDPAQEAAARREASRLHEQLFQGRRFESDSTMVLHPTLHWMGTTATPCEAS